VRRGPPPTPAFRDGNPCNVRAAGGIDAEDGVRSLRHPVPAARQRLFGRRLHFGGDARFRRLERRPVRLLTGRPAPPPAVERRGVLDKIGLERAAGVAAPLLPCWSFFWALSEDL